MADWSDKTIEMLKALWAEGITTAEIGLRMHISKNAVVGKAHRLNLPPRPSPIIRNGEPSAPRPLRRRSGALLPEHDVKIVNAVFAAADIYKNVPSENEVLAKLRALPAAAKVSSPCKFPLGRPREEGFRFCEDAGVPGKPYCAAHCQVAYVPLTVDRAARFRMTVAAE